MSDYKLKAEFDEAISDLRQVDRVREHAQGMVQGEGSQGLQLVRSLVELFLHLIAVLFSYFYHKHIGIGLKVEFSKELSVCKVKIVL